jgi:uncharacterized protein
MFGLIPKDEKFFEMFKRMSETIVQGAELLKEMLNNFPERVIIQQKIKDIEHKGDVQTHEIIKKLNKSFITPFDREDIYSLAGVLDDILDLIDAAAHRIVMYNIESPTPPAKELAFIILKSCEAVDKAVGKLGGDIEHLTEFCVEINSLENEADRVCHETISKLFQDEKDPIQLIKLKEIYEILELVTDKCENAANILESVVLKNA